MIEVTARPRIEGAIGLTWRRRGPRWEARWRARTDIAERGFKPAVVPMWRSDGLPDEARKAEIIRACERLQAEMHYWSKDPEGFARKIPRGRIYFITQGLAVKIGFSEDPAIRLMNLQSATYLELVLATTVPGTIEDERELHRRFAHLKIRNEWFRIDDEIRALIEASTQ